MKLRIKYNRRRGDYTIQQRSLFFWNSLGKTHFFPGGVAHFQEARFDTKEEAMVQVLKEMQRYEDSQREKEEREKINEEYVPIVLDSKDIREKYPELFL